MKKFAVLLTATITMVLAVTSPAVAANGCSLQKVTYRVTIEAAKPYLYVTGFTSCDAETSPLYKWEVSAPAVLTPFPVRQYVRGWSTQPQKFRLFFAKTKSGRRVLAGAGVAFSFGWQVAADPRYGIQYASETCFFNVSGSQGTVLPGQCLPGSQLVAPQIGGPVG